ncbi:MAG: hypothetical protein KJ727_07315 [Acidobacteria bacterium]|nr:hypothetical protein [Acidobacteriota bacterium]
MMNKENNILNISDKDLAFIKKVLTEEKKPFILVDLSQKLAFQKNSKQLNQEVKVYNPSGLYEVDDLIYRVYDEPLVVSSKGTEHFSGAVVLKVINKITYESFGCEMLEVDYTGGGIFRRHIDYMKKSKTQVLIPSNQDARNEKPDALKREEDPRLHELPMTDKDFRSLGKNLSHSLAGSGDFFSWNNFWQLSTNRIAVSPKQIDQVQKKINASQKSVPTKDLVRDLFSMKVKDPLFHLQCLSLNATLESLKKQFVFVSPEDEGRWHLKSILDALIQDLPLSAKRVRVPAYTDGIKPEISTSQKFPLKLYLTWRELFSGGVIIPKHLHRELAAIREYRFTDLGSGDIYTVYYYSNIHSFIGLKDYFQKHNVPQGSSLSLKRNGPADFSFSIKKGKKKIEIPKIGYNKDKDEFFLEKGDVHSYCMPNKIIFLEKNAMEELFRAYNLRKKADLQDLLVYVYKNFGFEGDDQFLHYLRAYHLLTLLKLTYQEDVETVLLNSPEFERSEKKKGIFFYREKIVTEDVEIEKKPAPSPSGAKTPSPSGEEGKKRMPSIGTIAPEPGSAAAEEMPKLRIIEPEVPPVREKIESVSPVEPARTKPVSPPTEREPKEKKLPEAEEAKLTLQKAKDEKTKKAKDKKKGHPLKTETERGARRHRKGVRKIREEEIELEESEMEALSALKSAFDDKVIEEPLKEEPLKEGEKKKQEEEYPVFVKDEEPTSGLFAAKLKTALVETKKEKEKQKAARKRRRR